MTAVKREDWKDIFVRAGKTLAQTFLATASVSLVMAGDVQALKSAAIGAVAAGIAVLWNAALAATAS